MQTASTATAWPAMARANRRKTKSAATPTMTGINRSASSENPAIFETVYSAHKNKIGASTPFARGRATAVVAIEQIQAYYSFVAPNWQLQGITG